MVKFFVPAVPEDMTVERVYDGIKSFAAMTTFKPTDRRIFRIEYVHGGKALYAEVGKANPVEGELVVAILEGNAYMVCTPSRGVLRGMPYLVGHEEIRDIQDFEPDEDK